MRSLATEEAERVERIRRLTFRSLPAVRVMSEGRLIETARRLAAGHLRWSATGSRRSHDRRLSRAEIELDRLTGLVPREFRIDSDATASLDRIGGAYDYAHNRLIIVPRLIQTRDQLEYTLAHELTHALEAQRFHLHLATLGEPGERSAVRRAVIEGSATLVQELYRQRYLHDRIPVAERVKGMRSVIGAAPGAYATNAQAEFDYADGALFARDLRRRADGWRLVDRALSVPPRQSSQILHPSTWPGGLQPAPIRLKGSPLPDARWRPLGGGVADEEQARAILLTGGIKLEASAAASGWDGGRFVIFKRRSDSGCAAGCAPDEAGAVAFRWRRPRDVDQFSLAVPAYMVAGRLAERADEGTWRLDTGYAALATGHRSSALAFAPTAKLSDELAGRAASSAAARPPGCGGEGHPGARTPRSGPQAAQRAHARISCAKSG